VAGLAIVGAGRANETGDEQVHADEGIGEVRSGSERVKEPQNGRAKKIDPDPH
jgi:hypothetical protein